MVAVLKKEQCPAEHIVPDQVLPIEPNEWLYVPGCLIYYCQLLVGHKGVHIDCNGREWRTRQKALPPGKRKRSRSAARRKAQSSLGAAAASAAHFLDVEKER
jgi:hypothetical protein